MPGHPLGASGMLLYAMTDDGVQLNSTYHMNGKTISVRTLDLGCEFDEIAAQLDAVVEEGFGDKASHALRN